VSERKSVADNVYKKRRGNRRERTFDLRNTYKIKGTASRSEITGEF
jgi:hypothetical protein